MAHGSGRFGGLLGVFLVVGIGPDFLLALAEHCDLKCALGVRLACLELGVSIQGFEYAPLGLDERLAHLPVQVTDEHVGQFGGRERTVSAWQVDDATAQRRRELLVLGGRRKLRQAGELNRARRRGLLHDPAAPF